jgi:hypothetical protein
LGYEKSLLLCVQSEKPTAGRQKTVSKSMKSNSQKRGSNGDNILVLDDRNSGVVIGEEQEEQLTIS